MQFEDFCHVFLRKVQLHCHWSFVRDSRRFKRFNMNSDPVFGRSCQQKGMPIKHVSRVIRLATVATNLAMPLKWYIYTYVLVVVVVVVVVVVAAAAAAGGGGGGGSSVVMLLAYHVYRALQQTRRLHLNALEVTSKSFTTNKNPSCWNLGNPSFQCLGSLDLRFPPADRPLNPTQVAQTTDRFPRPRSTKGTSTMARPRRWLRFFNRRVSGAHDICSSSRTDPPGDVFLRKKYALSTCCIPGTWNNPLLNGCCHWMSPNLYMKNGCFTKHPFKT